MNRSGIQVVLMALLLCSVNTKVWAVEFAGTGEPNSPYLIATFEQFDGADFTQPGVYYRLCSDVECEGTDMTLGRSGPFSAHLDGAGYRIKHARLLWSKSLLGPIESGATVTSLIVEDVALSFQYEYFGPIWTIGILATENYGTISNCHVTGWLAVPNAIDVGGLVGWNVGLIKNCSFEGCVTADWTPTELSPQGPPGVGGLVGMNAGSILNCYTTGTVLGKRAVGGLVGSNLRVGSRIPSIMNCYTTAVVIAELGGGGLVGVNGGILTRCYASGLVTGEMRGGLIGLSGQDDGTVVSCLWDPNWTNCRTSSGGLGWDLREAMGSWIYAANGWAGDPNWIANDDWILPEHRYLRLSWEGIKGMPIPEPQVPSWLAGSGTQEDPYQITSDGALNWLTTMSIVWDKHFVLTKDVDYCPARTIGLSRGSAFSGTFDGNGHAIRSVCLDTEGSTAWNLGVFGYVTGEIRNLAVENVRLVSGPNSRWVGLLAGTCEGLIENCRASGSVTVGRDSQYIGGLVGYVTGYCGDGCPVGRVVDCQVDATITAGEGSTDVGELIGYKEPDTRQR